MDTSALDRNSLGPRDFPLLAARLLLGIMFIWMGVNKLADPHHFLKMINEYGVLPQSPGIYLNASAIVLPWVEIVAGLCLLLGVFIRGASLSIMIMLAAFTPAVLFRALAVQETTGEPFMAIKFDCGCGTGAEYIWRKLLINTGLFLAAAVAMLSRSRRFCLSSLFAGSSSAEAGEAEVSPAA